MEFAYESYSVHALDYLLKPVRAEKLFLLLDQLLLREQTPQEGLNIRCGQTLNRIPFSQLSHVEVNGKRLTFTLADGTQLQTPGALKNYEQTLLARTDFFHIHRSYIVNTLQIAALTPASVQMFCGERLPVSRLLYPKLQAAYLRLMFTREEE